jgi:hypothetical protein
LRKQRTQDLLFGDLGSRKGSPQLPNEILGVGVVHEYLGYEQVRAVGEGGEINVDSKSFRKHTHAIYYTYHEICVRECRPLREVYDVEEARLLLC